MLERNFLVELKKRGGVISGDSSVNCDFRGGHQSWAPEKRLAPNLTFRKKNCRQSSLMTEAKRSS